MMIMLQCTVPELMSKLRLYSAKGGVRLGLLC